jgi:exonuclease III
LNMPNHVNSIINSIKKDNKFSILHLNVNSLSSKKTDIFKILDQQIVDIFMLNETKLDSLIHPNSSINHKSYVMLRNDRDSHGGGNIVYIKREYNISKSILLNDFEAIYFQIKHETNFYNFLSCYRSPSFNETDFLHKLEDFIFSINLNEPLFLIGDLNFDLLDKDCKLFDFINNYNLFNFVNKPTRISNNYHSKKNEFICKESLIDIVLHNQNLILSTEVIDSIISDHQFVLTKMDIKQKKLEPTFIRMRNLSQTNLIKITERIESSNFNNQASIDNVNDKWTAIRDKILQIIDSIAPEKLVSSNNIRSRIQPWFDNELTFAQIERDTAYSDYKMTRQKSLYEIFINSRNNFNKLNNSKMIDYFKNKQINDFCNNKKFWEFYSSTYTIKSDRNNSIEPNFVSCGEDSASDPESISTIFNVFFTSIESSSDLTLEECKNFNDEHFKNLNLTSKLNGQKFYFKTTNTIQVHKILNELSSTSGAGCCGIATKILKSSSHVITPIITGLINDCILKKVIPTDWKTAIVTPLYKNKGSINEVNNYRGISVIAPIAKVFERIIVNQIVYYLYEKELLFNGQFGFRPFHSCEAALHHIISQMNQVLSLRNIGLFLFIDFKKAFDMVDSKLLLHKLKFYGFSDDAINLIANYFTDRCQSVKFKHHLSDQRPVKLGVSQGTCCGPVLFLLFINDLPWYLSIFKSLLFADDTTLSLESDSLVKIYSEFTCGMDQLARWCKFNKMDINWDKTKIMFVTNKKDVLIPEKISYGNISIEVVTNFTLLGVNIDNKLNFENYVSTLRAKINKRLFSIKKLFFLAKSVKIQFFKTFILPIFDYCLSLSIYYSNKAIQKLFNCYNTCLFKLFNFKQTVDTRYINQLNNLNNQLELEFNIPCLLHRILIKLMLFSHKIINIERGPILLRNKLKFNHELGKTYEFRNANELHEPSVSKYNEFAVNTFDHFFSRFINQTYIHHHNLNYQLFTLWTKNNVNIIFPLFIEKFKQFEYLDCKFN